MKNITKIIISTFLVILLANGALGFPGMGGNSNATNTTNANNIPQDTGTMPQINLNNTTESDQDLIMIQHLIEVDAVQLKAENKLFIRETLTFRNVGTKNFFGDLKAWVPDGSESINVARSEMMTGSSGAPIAYSQNGNIISWKDFVEQNSRLPFLYALEYRVKQNEAGTTSNAAAFHKKLAVPTIISYPYKEKQGLPAIIVKITQPEGNTVKFTDENGNKIAATEVDEKGEIFMFSSPEFTEINVEISPSLLPTSTSQSYAIYIILGIVIILIISYPYIRKKLKSDKNGKETTEETEEEIEEPSEADSPVSSGKYERKKVNELGDLKKQFISRIKDLEKKYESGDLLDEEYEEKRKSYQDNLKEIEMKLKKMG